MEEYCLSYLEISGIGLISFIFGALLSAVCKH